MNDHPTTDTGTRPGPARARRLRAAALAAAVGGGALLGAFVAVPAVSMAQEPTTTTTAPGAPDGTTRRPPGPRTVDGRTEEALTGDTKAKVEAAVLAAYPGATIDRSETDVDGATYEAHIRTADGQRLTVLLGADFAITGTEQGRGPGGPGGGRGGCDGQPPAEEGTTAPTS